MANAFWQIYCMTLSSLTSSLLDLILGLSWPQGHGESPFPANTQGMHIPAPLGLSAPALVLSEPSSPQLCPVWPRVPLSWGRDALHPYYLSLRGRDVSPGFSLLVGISAMDFLAAAFHSAQKFCVLHKCYRLCVQDFVCSVSVYLTL